MILEVSFQPISGSGGRVNQERPLCALKQGNTFILSYIYIMKVYDFYHKNLVNRETFFVKFFIKEHLYINIKAIDATLLNISDQIKRILVPVLLLLWTIVIYYLINRLMNVWFFRIFYFSKFITQSIFPSPHVNKICKPCSIYISDSLLNYI